MVTSGGRPTPECITLAPPGMSVRTTPNRWSTLRREHPRATLVAVVLIALFLVADGVLASRWLRYRAETARLRAGMSDAERQRTDMIIATESNKVGVMLELIRRQAASDRALHLAVAVDSGRMRLERDGALLRDMRVVVGGERAAASLPESARVVRPRGARTVEQVLGASDPWDVPTWLFTDRAVPAPADRRVRGVLGRNAIVLTGGTVIYATPDSGVLADSSYVIPGSIRVARADLQAIAPNLAPGVTVYFYE